MNSFLEKAYAPLEDTQVDAHFWCIGEHAARWQSNVLEQLGDIHSRRYESAQSYTHTENIRQMVERGEDPQQANHRSWTPTWDACLRLSAHER